MTTTPPQRSKAATMSLGLAIGALVLAALMGGFFIIVGDQANIAGRAWLTLFLVLLFAGAVVIDAQLATGPNPWYLGVSTIVNVLLVAIGLLKLWNGWLQGENTSDPTVWSTQFGRLLAIVVLLRFALLIAQVYGLYFVTRAKSEIGRFTAIVTIGLVAVAALVLATPAALPAFAWPDWWWRIAGAASLVAVVMAVIPLIIRAFDPKPPVTDLPAAVYGTPQPAGAQPAYQPVPPEYAATAAVADKPAPVDAAASEQADDESVDEPRPAK